jgi:dTDP-4-amino-4,6-dideoxygalactose transaminase
MAEPQPFIPLAKPVLGEPEAAAARRAILSGWVTQGPEVVAFEREFAAVVGAPHACAVSSCTTALHLALLAVGVKPGDEVITVSHSYIATANSVRYCGGRPVFIDIDPVTFNLDPARIEPALTTKTRAILCVHQMGMPCDLRAILEIARRRSLPVIEDAACAIGSERARTALSAADSPAQSVDKAVRAPWEKIGKPHADIACFSFHPRKVITTGDGGMLTTANAEWDAQFRLWRQHGMSVTDAVRHQAREVIFESYPVLGYNYRMTDIQAAVGREQLKRLPELIERRRDLAVRYRKLLSDIPELHLPEEPDWARTNWQSYCVRLTRSHNQKSVMQAMLDAGIATRRGILCAHREAAYEQVYGKQSLPVSEEASDRSIVLPLFHEMTEAEQDHVAETLRGLLG